MPIIHVGKLLGLFGTIPSICFLSLARGSFQSAVLVIQTFPQEAEQCAITSAHRLQCEFHLLGTYKNVFFVELHIPRVT